MVCNKRLNVYWDIGLYVYQTLHIKTNTTIIGNHITNLLYRINEIKYTIFKIILRFIVVHIPKWRKVGNPTVSAKLWRETTLLWQVVNKIKQYRSWIILLGHPMKPPRVMQKFHCWTVDNFWCSKMRDTWLSCWNSTFQWGYYRIRRISGSEHLQNLISSNVTN